MAKLLQYFGQITAVISGFTAVICKNYSLTVVLFQLGGYKCTKLKQFKENTGTFLLILFLV